MTKEHSTPIELKRADIDTLPESLTLYFLAIGGQEFLDTYKASRTYQDEQQEKDLLTVRQRQRQVKEQGESDIAHARRILWEELFGTYVGQTEDGIPITTIGGVISHHWRPEASNFSTQIDTALQDLSTRREALELLRQLSHPAFDIPLLTIRLPHMLYGNLTQPLPRSLDTGYGVMKLLENNELGLTLPADPKLVEAVTGTHHEEPMTRAELLQKAWVALSRIFFEKNKSPVIADEHSLPLDKNGADGLLAALRIHDDFSPLFKHVSARSARE